MTPQQSVDEHKYTILGMLAECQTAGKRGGPDIAREWEMYQKRTERIIREIHEAIEKRLREEALKPPPAPLRNGVPPATQPQAPVPRGK